MVLDLALEVVCISVKRVDNEFVAFLTDLFCQAGVPGGDFEAAVNIHTTSGGGR